MKLLDKFKGMASVMVADGALCLFWEDCWSGRPLKLEFPELFSFAKKANVSLKNVHIANHFSSLFHLPLSVEAFGQLQIVENLVQAFQPSMQVDSWHYIWGSVDGSYCIN